MADYDRAGMLVLRGDRILLCRKRTGTSKLLLPGGQIEPGESDLECLARELREELGEVTAARLEYVGTYLDRAASDDLTIEKSVQVRLYRGDLVGEPVASSEIGELVWFGPGSDQGELTPVFLNRILPDLLVRRLLPWGTS